MSEWTEHVAKWRNCQRCALAKQRNRICLARGTTPCDVVFIGIGPGESEDAVGAPFKGPAGRLLQQIIDRALPRNITYALTNLVACFPLHAKRAGTNDPEPDEIKACAPRLVEFVRLCRPRMIVLVGGLPKRYISGAAMFRSDDEDGQPNWIPEGKYLEFCDIIHPAAILKGDMPLAKKQGAANKCIVTIRRAVEDMLDPDGQGARDFTNEVNNDASLPSAESMRLDHERWGTGRYDDTEIPF